MIFWYKTKQDKLYGILVIFHETLMEIKSITLHVMYSRFNISHSGRRLPLLLQSNFCLLFVFVAQ